MRSVIAGVLIALMLLPSLQAGEAGSLLFVRGADRSGGFLEAGDDASRTEHLGDLFNMSTARGNHGWGQLRQTLEQAGFLLDQIEEQPENSSGPSGGVAIAFETVDLSAYDGIVFGSNNAVYSEASIDAIEAFVVAGGGVLFISDANFGGDWADAADSDQQFLDRFDLVMNQDQGTYAIRRNDGEFVVPDHPIFEGVDAFDGEGVSPLGSVPADARLAGAQGSTRVNEPPFGGQRRGASRPVTESDAVVVALAVGAGRVLGHFDRNTFFNENGAGTDITRLDNRQYARNLFGYLVQPDTEIIFRGGFEASPF